MTCSDIELKKLLRIGVIDVKEYKMWLKKRNNFNCDYIEDLSIVSKNEAHRNRLEPNESNSFFETKH